MNPNHVVRVELAKVGGNQTSPVTSLHAVAVIAQGGHQCRYDAGHPA